MITSTLFCALLIRILAKLSWVRIVTYAVVLAVLVDVVFEMFLKVPLPHGVLGMLSAKGDIACNSTGPQIPAEKQSVHAVDSATALAVQADLMVIRRFQRTEARSTIDMESSR